MLGLRVHNFNALVEFVRLLIFHVYQNKKLNRYKIVRVCVGFFLFLFSDPSKLDFNFTLEIRNIFWHQTGAGEKILLNLHAQLIEIVETVLIEHRDVVVVVELSNASGK